MTGQARARWDPKKRFPPKRTKARNFPAPQAAIVEEANRSEFLYYPDISQTFDDSHERAQAGEQMRERSLEQIDHILQSIAETAFRGRSPS